MSPDPIADLIARVDAERLRRRLFYLARDPLPYRKANATLRGHCKSTLDEADDYIAMELAACGYSILRQPCAAQAFRCDDTKPAAHQYSPPGATDPIYSVFNLRTERLGITRPSEIVLLLAHKDSQSWNDSPGAYDNAAGTVALMEIAQILSNLTPRRTLRYLFCNEEHTPWSSVTAARLARQRGDDIVALQNVDSLAGKGQEAVAAGLHPNVTEYTTPEGERIANLMAEVNERYNLGLQQSAYLNESPGDDHGVFYRQGYRAVVMHAGSAPYEDPNYHLMSDTPDRVDIPNLVAATKAVLAATVMLAME